MYATSPRVEFLRTLSKLRKGKKIPHCLFTSSIKHENRHFHVVAVLWWQRNVQKREMHVQSYCFAYSTYFIFDYLVAAAVVGS